MISKDFLSFAKKINTDNLEAARRSAVSRAYYSIFHHIRDIFNSVSFPLSRGSVHSNLIKCLRFSNLPDIKFIGERLDTLHKIRKQADYDLLEKKFENKKNCAWPCDMAETLFKDVDTNRTALTSELESRKNEFVLLIAPK